eukprot:TRINITY_DN1915_c2_g2_i2.p1 TRINITY_DN1915_c2_g2~~TRINITY_DN1915_c2_g2_i2.p1  ORF type:complete len:755 (-),score=234.95 TRINITY_DN1915_c2_g2_i2:239-2503(-)
MEQNPTRFVNLNGWICLFDLILMNIIDTPDYLAAKEALIDTFFNWLTDIEEHYNVEPDAILHIKWTCEVEEPVANPIPFQISSNTQLSLEERLKLLMGGDDDNDVSASSGIIESDEMDSESQNPEALMSRLSKLSELLEDIPPETARGERPENDDLLLNRIHEEEESEELTATKTASKSPSSSSPQNKIISPSLSSNNSSSEISAIKPGGGGGELDDILSQTNDLLRDLGINLSGDPTTSKSKEISKISDEDYDDELMKGSATASSMQSPSSSATREWPPKPNKREWPPKPASNPGSSHHGHGPRRAVSSAVLNPVSAAPTKTTSNRGISRPNSSMPSSSSSSSSNTKSKDVANRNNGGGGGESSSSSSSSSTTDSCWICHECSTENTKGKFCRLCSNERLPPNFPHPPSRPTNKFSGEGQDEYKVWMKERFIYQEWENCLIVYKKHLKEGNSAGCQQTLNRVNEAIAGSPASSSSAPASTTSTPAKEQKVWASASKNHIGSASRRATLATIAVSGSSDNSSTTDSNNSDHSEEERKPRSKSTHNKQNKFGIDLARVKEDVSQDEEENEEDSVGGGVGGGGAAANSSSTTSLPSIQVSEREDGSSSNHHETKSSKKDKDSSSEKRKKKDNKGKKDNNKDSVKKMKSRKGSMTTVNPSTTTTKKDKKSSEEHISSSSSSDLLRSSADNNRLTITLQKQPSTSSHDDSDRSKPEDSDDDDSNSANSKRRGSNPSTPLKKMRRTKSAGALSHKISKS